MLYRAVSNNTWRNDLLVLLLSCSSIVTSRLRLVFLTAFNCGMLGLSSHQLYGSWVMFRVDKARIILQHYAISVCRKLKRSCWFAIKVLLLLSSRTHCLRWSVSCRPAHLTLWSVSAPTQAVTLTVSTASTCLPSCNTSGCSRWSVWSVMDTRSVCLSRASSAGQCRQWVISIKLIYWVISLLRQNNHILTLPFLVFNKNVRNQIFCLMLCCTGQIH